MSTRYEQPERHEERDNAEYYRLTQLLRSELMGNPGYLYALGKLHATEGEIPAETPIHFVSGDSIWTYTTSRGEIYDMDKLVRMGIVQEGLVPLEEVELMGPTQRDSGYILYSLGVVDLEVPTPGGAIKAEQLIKQLNNPTA